MVRVFQYRLYPTPAQKAALENTLESMRLLYNAALEERRNDYERAKEAALARMDGSKPKASVSHSTQEKSVKFIKAICPEYDALHTHLYQTTLERLDRAFQAFFDRCKKGKTPGFPRFKSFGRFRSFTFKEAGNGNKLLGKDDPVRRKRGDTSPDYPELPAEDDATFKVVAGGKRLYLHGIGKVKIKLHRPYEGRAKQVRLIKKQGHWYAQLSCDEVPIKPLPPTGKSVGIDLGIKTFAAMSDGRDVPNPRIKEKAQPAIAKAQRRVSKRKRRSKRRHKAVVLLAKHHGRVQATRLTFHHTIAKEILENYDMIAVEDLNVKGLARGFLSKQVHDVGWGQFTQILANKAESARREVILVEPSGTTQECSGCHREVRKGLHVRVHECHHCGLRLDRDTNAAINIERLGHSLRGGCSSGAP